jgi:hypothetical protein
MPIRISDLANKRKEITVEWEGEAIRLAFRPGSMALDAEVKAAESKEGNERGPIIESLRAMVLWWDIVDDDGKVAPISYEVLDRLPFPLLFAMNRAIIGAMYPNRQSAVTTAAG